MSKLVRGRSSRSVVLCALLALLITACAGPTPPSPAPSGNEQPDATDAVSPLPSGATPEPSARPTPDLAAADDLLDGAGQPALLGLYLPDGYGGRGSDHYAFIQGPPGCDDLISILGAGQWSVAARAATPRLTPDPEQGIPELSSIEWLLLRLGGEYALARVGGDDSGCLAQVWRAASQPVAASGAVEIAGQARGIQLLCYAGMGQAIFTSLYLADGATMLLQTTVPLTVGSHSIDLDTELTMGQTAFPPDGLVTLLTNQLDEEEPVPGMDAFFPADFEEGAWEGTVEVTSVEPLVGEITFEDLRDERGRSQSLTAGFRCDLPPGQLARAAEAPTTPTPEPTEGPEAGSLQVTIGSGPHAGTHQITSHNVSCSFGLLTEGAWTLTWNPDDESPPGELQGLLATVRPAGGRSNALMYFGDDPDEDWFDSEQASGQATETGSAVEFSISGRTRRDVDFEIQATCRDVETF